MLDVRPEDAKPLAVFDRASGWLGDNAGNCEGGLLRFNGDEIDCCGWARLKCQLGISREDMLARSEKKGNLTLMFFDFRS